MQDIKTLLQPKLNNNQTTGINNLTKPVVNKYHRTNVLYSDCKDLINPVFEKWYYKTFFKLGFEKVNRLASQARTDGKNPQKLFSALLKKELSKSFMV